MERNSNSCIWHAVYGRLEIICASVAYSKTPTLNLSHRVAPRPTSIGSDVVALLWRTVHESPDICTTWSSGSKGGGRPKLWYRREASETLRYVSIFTDLSLPLQERDLRARRPSTFLFFVSYSTGRFRVYNTAVQLTLLNRGKAF